ncbi:helix-turn-helix transcriptional regulator [Candidatus Nomurabacteria bacterium]|nr:helix-turn-helix transcriptional regulator [Candidatus Nomurabacteria bacterium]
MQTTLKKEIAKRKRKFSQKEIAERFNISQQHLSYLLNGKRNNPELLEKIREYIKKEGLA